LRRRRKKKKEEQEEQEQEENRLDLLLHFAIVQAFDPSTYVRKWAEETKELRPKEWRNEEEEDDEDEEGSHHQSAKP
jgi:hypothetical protein